MDLKKIKNSIRTVPDFPKKGIQFKDISTLLQNPIAFDKIINRFFEKFRTKK